MNCIQNGSIGTDMSETNKFKHRRKYSLLHSQNKELNNDHHSRHRKYRNDCLKSRIEALEQAYVHDVYSTIALDPKIQIISPIRPFIKEFVLNFESGSLLLDVGCGDGKYLNLSTESVFVGLEYCPKWFRSKNFARTNDDCPKYLLLGNVLCLPFRDDLFDGVICCSVLHHLSTLERRVKALKEIVRIMKIGGRIMLTVTSATPFAKPLQSQDVLIKIDCSKLKKSERFRKNPQESFESSGNSSDLSNNEHQIIEKNEMNMVNDPLPKSSSNSELENCYSFFRKAIKRLSLASSTIYPFKFSPTNNYNSYDNDGESHHQSNHNDSDQIIVSGSEKVLDLNHNYYPIDLRNLEEDLINHQTFDSFSTEVDSALCSINRSSECSILSQNSSQFTTPPPSSSSLSSSASSSSKLFAAIKGQLISWKTQMSKSLEQQWNSFDLIDESRIKHYRNQLVCL
ncbi:tRNA methyltransferase-like protein [Sarcoptes scabiei]|uniref:tRNA methyltransferase-like protein n=1 Tax=Sarcoptes scabiei TaxID=52283 RepID=A0A132A8T5_SARSC|nr:tRNA methyltransferase-like protein [Sarcoptes scabiei]